MLSINPQNKEELINNDTTFGQEEICKRCNNQLGHGLAYVAVSDENLSMRCGSNDSENNATHQQADYLVNYGDPEIDYSNKRFFDLSHIQDEQKYLKVMPNDKDDIIKLETRGGKGYCVKLKELYTNEEGEWVMTLSHVAKNTGSLIICPLLNESRQYT